MHDIEMLRTMLKDFGAITLSKPDPPTFMEIAGYPHLENVCSNILSFFLTTDECHRMGDLLLRSLLMAAGQQLDQICFQDVVVKRENRTDQMKRIDLLIESDHFIIGIENKVFSGVNNDLRHYADHVRKKGKDGKEIVLILLSLNVTNGPDLHSFVPVTYAQWFSEIRQLLGQYALDGDQRYLVYLMDFMRTIERLGRRPVMNSELAQFLADNREAIDSLIGQVKLLRAELKKEASALSQFVTYDESLGINQWVWTSSEDFESALVHELPFMGNRDLAINVFVRLTGLSIDISTRKPGPEDLVDWLRQRDIVVKKPAGDRFVCAEFPYGASKEEVGALLSQLLSKISVDPIHGTK